MKLKIIRTTEAIDADMELDEMVNEFCENVVVIDINCQTEDGETYCYIKYLDKAGCDDFLAKRKLLTEQPEIVPLRDEFCQEVQDVPADYER